MKILGWPARKNAAHNPFQKLLYDAVEQETEARVAEFSPRALLARQAPDILHLHWPDVFLAAGTGWRFWMRLALLRGILLLARLRGVKVVWTAHNLQRTDQRNGARMRRVFWPWFTGALDGVIYMTRPSSEEAGRLMPALRAVPSAVIPHGHYGPTMPAVLPEPAGEDARLSLLFFGSITRYKNANRVLKSFLELPPGLARLRICGKMSSRSVDTELLELLAQLPADRADEVHFDDRFLPEAELITEIRNTDLVVFPYSDVLNSGAAIFALSAGRPLLASDNALFRELQGQVGPDWIRLIEGELDGTQLRAALEAARRLRDSGARPDLSAFDWSRIARQTVAFYDSLR